MKGESGGDFAGSDGAVGVSRIVGGVARGRERGADLGWPGRKVAAGCYNLGGGKPP